MAFRALDRLLLVPALIVLGSVTLAGCSLLPGNPSSNSSNSSDDQSEQSNEDSSDESSDSDADAVSDVCPAEFVKSAATASGLGGTTEIISAADFSAPEVGASFLDGGCIFRISVDTEGAEAVHDVALISGDDARKAEISANLAAAGFAEMTEGFYTLNRFSVVVLDGSTMMTAEQLAAGGLDLGDSFLMVLASSQGGERVQ